MRVAPLLGILLAAICAAGTPLAVPPPRTHLNSGACLSCHSQDLATLPQAPCVSCHLGNMDFVEGHDGPSTSPGFWILAAAGGSGILALLVLGIAGLRRAAPVCAALAVVVMAAPGSGPSPHDSLQGARHVSEGFACDLSPVLAPRGDALLFCRRGPDTDGDGRVDLRDGMALFLLREGWDLPRRITPYRLDVQGAMASWSPEGSAFCTPLPALGNDPPGLALFDLDGNRKGFIPSAGEEVLSPQFSPEGDRIAFVEGKGIAVWDLARNRRSWALEPLNGPFFPRLCGWSPWGGDPLFTRGIEYPTLERGPDGKLLLPTEVPLEEASGERAVLLTPPGSVPSRRFKPQPVPGGVFYLAQGPGGFPRLIFFDGRSEIPWSPPSAAIHGFAATEDGQCWCWMAAGAGVDRLVRFLGPGSLEDHGPTVRANLLALVLTDSGGAWFSGASGLRKPRGLYGKTGEWQGVFSDGAVFGIAASGDALATVTVRADSDGDGERTPWDRAVLGISWRRP
jgi:hypothetical protein